MRQQGRVWESGDRHRLQACGARTAALTSISIVRPKSLITARSLSVEISPLLSDLPPSAMNASTAQHTRNE